jgi:hypothetical protein
MSIPAISHVVPAQERRSAVPGPVNAPQPVQAVQRPARDSGRSATAQAMPIVEVPDEPKPVTTATVAVHIMKVPSSRVLEAFVAMQRALGRQDETARKAVPTETAVAHGKAAAYGADRVSRGMEPAGTVVDVRV